MTKAEWSAEVTAALDAAAGGSTWRVFKVWVEQTSPMMHAELTSGGVTKRIALARDRFTARDERRIELLRQLYGDSLPHSTKAGRQK